MKECLRFIINFLIDLFLFIFKRDKHIVVCTGWGGERFADNSRYIYLYLNENKLSLQLHKIIWLTDDVSIKQELRDAGFSVYMKKSYISVFYHLRAKSFFYDQFSDDFYVLLTRGAQLINLWHGMPIKRFGLWNGLNWNLKNDYLLTCSDFGDTTIGKAFHIAPDHFIHGMYPRNYYLNRKIPFLTKGELKYMDLLMEQKSKGKKVLFYLPTFRKSKSQFMGVADLDQVTGFIDFLLQHDYFLMTKVHFGGYHFHKDSVPSIENGLLNLSPQTDIYPFLKETDLLITDYSSVLFDFLYLDRDIICYPYDLHQYQNENKGFLLDYQALPADKVYTLDELENNLLHKMNERDSHSEGRKLWLEKCFENKTINDTIKLSLS